MSAASRPTRMGAPRCVAKTTGVQQHMIPAVLWLLLLPQPTALTGTHHHHFCALGESGKKREVALPVSLKISASHLTATIFQNVYSENRKDFTNWCANETKTTCLVLF